MKDKEFLYQQEALNAVLQNDILKMKKNLDNLMLLKKSNVIKDIFNKFKYLSTHFFEANSVQVDHEGLIKDLLMNSITLKKHEITEYLLNSNELVIKPDLKSPMIWEVIFKDGKLNHLQHLLSNSNIKEEEKGRLVTYGMTDIKESNIEMLDLIFDSSRFGYTEFIEGFNKHNRINSPLASFNPFIHASSINSKLLVNVYLEKEEIKPLINDITFHKGLFIAAKNNSLDLLKHLLLEPNMPYKLSQDCADELIYMATLGNATEVLKFLIFDMDIKLEKNLDEILDIERLKRDNQNELKMGSIIGQEYKKGVDSARKFFATRDLKEQLTKDLDSDINPIASKKPKL